LFVFLIAQQVFDVVITSKTLVFNTPSEQEAHSWCEAIRTVMDPGRRQALNLVFDDGSKAVVEVKESEPVWVLLERLCARRGLDASCNLYSIDSKPHMIARSTETSELKGRTLRLGSATVVNTLRKQMSSSGLDGKTPVPTLIKQSSNPILVKQGSNQGMDVVAPPRGVARKHSNPDAPTVISPRRQQNLAQSMDTALAGGLSPRGGARSLGKQTSGSVLELNEIDRVKCVENVWRMFFHRFTGAAPKGCFNRRSCHACSS
jgi:hypothetical protein